MTNQLKEIRMKEYMMTKKAFSELLNINEKQYFRYEKGDSVPSIQVALKISNKLNRSINDIWQE